MKAAREACPGKVIAIVQPHRFTRLESLFDEFAACFNDADTVILAPVYAAGEDPIDGVSSAALSSRLKSGGHRDVRLIDDEKEIAPLIRNLAQRGDFVIFLGAGNITLWAARLADELAAIDLAAQ